MAKNTMTDLRNHLFETLEALKDEDNPMETERARAISLVADKLIASAKVEVEFLKATGSRETSKFMDEGPKQLEPVRRIS
jgi:hypothetical protein